MKLKHQRGFAPLIVVILAVLSLSLAGGGYIVYKDKQEIKNPEENIKTQENQSEDLMQTPTPTSIPTTNSNKTADSSIQIESKLVKPQKEPEPEVSILSNEISEETEVMIFVDNLNSCTPYKMKFVHPLTGDNLEKKIVGIINGKCNYVEQMPNGGKMECNYSVSERKAVAQEYKDLAVSDTTEFNLTFDLSSGESKSTYMIDDKVVKSPSQEAFNSGTCVISGY